MLFRSFPNILLEAMACGVAVVSFDCDFGPRDIISPGEGILCPPGDVDALASEIGRLLHDEEGRAAMARLGQLAVERFRPQRVMPLWDDVVIS